MGRKKKGKYKIKIAAYQLILILIQLIEKKIHMMTNDYDYT